MKNQLVSEISLMASLIEWGSMLTMGVGPWIMVVLVFLLLIREGLVATDRYVGKTRYIDFVIAPLFLIFISVIGYILFLS